MKTDCTPESDVGASARLTFSVELGPLLPPPQAGNNAQDTRADARTDRKTARFIDTELITPLSPSAPSTVRSSFRTRAAERMLNVCGCASHQSPDERGRPKGSYHNF